MFKKDFLQKFAQKIQQAHKNQQFQDSNKLNTHNIGNPSILNHHNHNLGTSLPEAGFQNYTNGFLNPHQQFDRFLQNQQCLLQNALTNQYKNQFSYTGGLYNTDNQSKKQIDSISDQNIKVSNLALHDTSKNIPNKRSQTSNNQNCQIQISQNKNYSLVNQYQINSEDSLEYVDEQLKKGLDSTLSQSEKKQILLHRLQNAARNQDVNHHCYNKQNRIEQEDDQIINWLKEDNMNSLSFPTKTRRHKNEKIQYTQNRVPSFYLDKITKINDQQNTKISQFLISPKGNNLTDGRQFTQNFRRSFVAKLLTKTQNVNCQAANEIVRLASNKISVYPYEIRAWLAAYQIIFIIQAEQQATGQNFEQNQMMRRISQLFLSYLTQNRQQKRYKLVKILTYTFRNFGIPEGRVNPWLNKLINQTHKNINSTNLEPQNWKLSRQISKNHQNNANICKTVNIHPVQQKSKVQIKQQKRLRKQSQNPLMVPGNLKKNIAEDIDTNLKMAFQGIIQQKSIQFQFSTTTVRAIHQQYGRFSLFLKPSLKSTATDKHQIKQISQVKTLTQPPPQYMNKKPIFQRNFLQTNSYDKKNDNILLSRLQGRLSFFIKKNPNCQIAVIERQADMGMQHFGFSDRLKFQVRRQWFAYFLKKYQIKVPQATINKQQIKGQTTKVPLMSPMQNRYLQKHKNDT